MIANLIAFLWMLAVPIAMVLVIVYLRGIRNATQDAARRLARIEQRLGANPLDTPPGDL
jgi:hypothetical protein